MYISIYIHVYICTHIYIHAYIYTYMYSNINVTSTAYSLDFLQSQLAAQFTQFTRLILPSEFYVKSLQS